MEETFNNDSYQLFLRKYQMVMNKCLFEYDEFLQLGSNTIQNIFLENFSSYSTGISTLSKAYNHLLKTKEVENVSQSFDFSIFDIIKFKRKEEHLHSPLLSKLLDTKGSHGQQDLFYRLFLKQVLQDDEKITKFTNSDYRDYYFKEEEYIKDDIGHKGEIDLTIKSINRNKRFAIILENKWNSSDSCVDQIYKYYRNFVNIQGYDDSNLLVFYLTKKGYDPQWVEHEEFDSFLKNNKNINYFPISYEKHILRWLTECLIHSKSLKVNFLIEQYLKHIQDDINNRR